MRPFRLESLLPLLPRTPFPWDDGAMVDALLLAIHARGGQRLVVPQKGDPRVERDGQAWPLPLPGGLYQVVQERLMRSWDVPAPLVDRWKTGVSIEHMHDLVVDRFTALRVRLRANPGDWAEARMTWALLPAVPQPLMALDLPKALSERLHALPAHGLVMVGGSLGVGTTTLLNALVRRWSQQSGAHAYARKGCTVEPLVEQYLWDGRDPSSLAQREIRARDGSPDSLVHAMTSLVRGDPDLTMVSEVRERPVLETLVRLAETQRLALGGLYDGQGVVSMVRRLRGLAGADEARAWVVSNLHLLVWQTLVEGADGQGVRLREHLALDGPLRAELAVASEARRDEVLRQAMIGQGSDLLSDARVRRAQGRLDDAGFARVEALVAAR